MNHARRALGLAIILAISHLLAAFIARNLHREEHWLILLISAIVATILILISNKINPARWVFPIRKWFFQIAHYEGFWVSYVNHPDRPKSISQIYYSYKDSCWICEGYALSNSYKIVASWKGTSIYFDPESGYWFFKGTWHVHDRGSPYPLIPALDQFFKIKTIRGVFDSFSTVIVDNADNIDRDASSFQPEILTSEARRVNSLQFNDAFHFVPRKIEDLTKCHDTDFSRLFFVLFPDKLGHDARSDG